MKNNFKSLLCSACYEMKVRTRGTKLTKKTVITVHPSVVDTKANIVYTVTGNS